MIIDTHAHLDGQEFESDRDAVIRRAAEQGVGAIISAGVDIESSRASVQLSEQYDWVYAAVGVHPHEAARLTPDLLDEIESMASHPRVVAIGEIGLDFYRNLSPREAQVTALVAQLELASRVGLPVIMHSRQAAAESLEMLRKWVLSRRAEASQPLGVMHCFSGDERDASALMDIGFLVSFAGPITFPRSEKTRRVASRLPLDQLLVETDCPYLTPSAHYGQRNEPSFVWDVARGLAEAQGKTLDEVASATTENAGRLFRLPLTRKEDIGDTRAFPAHTRRPT